MRSMNGMYQDSVRSTRLLPKAVAEPAAEVRGGGRRDLRRGLTPAELDRVQARLEHLPSGERALIEAMFLDHKTAVQIAALAGRDPRKVRGEIRRVVDRMLSPKFAFVLRRGDAWPTTRRKVAHACVLWGFSARVAAKELGISLHAVRRQVDAIHAMFEAEGLLAGSNRAA